MSDELLIFGTSFPSIENDNKDYVPVWKQKAVSSKGTKRFHGAFEGGFSAGYFNSVGSKEGWKPTEFVSSRENKHKYVDSLENYMDEDDKIEFNSKDLVFIKSKKDVDLERLLKNSGFSDDRAPENDPLLSILLCYNSNIEESIIGQPISMVESEAFSGGGAWDEDDDRIELYENRSSLHLASNKLESSNNVADDILNLAFGHAAELSDYVFYPAPQIPSDYVPVRIIDEMDFSLDNISHAAGSKTLLLEQQLVIRTPDIDEKTASASLKGFMPFGEDPDKQTRYVKYLRACSNKINIPDLDKSKLYTDEKEREEFIMSAQIFKPSSLLISSRFESSSTLLQPQVQLKPGLSRHDATKKPVQIQDEPPEIDKKLPHKNESNLKRAEHVWSPNSLLCKRFNLSPPDTGLAGSIELKRVKPVLTDESIGHLVDVLVKESKSKIQFEVGKKNNQDAKEDSVPVMPPADLFKEIFGANVGELQSKSRSRAIDYFD